MAVTYGGIGTVVSGTASVTAQWPAGTYTTGDLGVLVIEAGGEGTTVTPAGWTHFPGSPIVDVADLNGSKLHVLYKRATSSAEANVITGDTGDHQVAVIYTFNNVRRFGNPYSAITTATKTTASTTATIPTITTDAANQLVVAVVGRPNDAATLTSFGVMVNANLTGIAEAGEAGTTSGHGGGFVLDYGTKATAGATGSGTMTKTVSTTDTVMVFALAEEFVPTIALNTTNGATVTALTFTGTDAGGDVLTYEIQIDTLNTFDSQ